MAGFKALSTGAKAALLVGGAAFAGLAAYGGYSTRQVAAPAPTAASDAQSVAAPQVPAVSEPSMPNPGKSSVIADNTASVAPQIQPDMTPANNTIAYDPDPAPLPVPTSTAPFVPTFDVVRVDPDGTTVVAGVAEPGAKIILRVGGAETSATTADDNGNFAAFFVLDSSKSPRMLTMTSILADQTEVKAGSEVALAPTQTQVVVAAVQPERTVPQIASGALAGGPVDPAQVTEVKPTPDVNKAVAETAPAALLITKDGVNVLQPSASTAEAEPASGVTIDTISYTATGDVQLAGRAAPGAILRFYLNNAPLADVLAGKNGLWAATMPAILPGLYTLRADQLNADGTVTARFETPFKRETSEALAAAVQAPDAIKSEPAGTVSPATGEELPAAQLPASEPAVTSDAPATQLAAADQATTAGTPADSADMAVDATQGSSVAQAQPAQQTAAISVTVQPGFTLWGIASQQFGDGVLYVQVYQANKDKIRDPDLIYPGQVFVIPSASN